MDNASTQMELLNAKAAVQTSDCSKCRDLSPGARTGGRTARKRCAQVEDFLQLVAELQEAARKLCNIRGAEELDSYFQAQSAVDPQPMAKQPKIPPWTHTEGREASNAEEWKPAKTRTCRMKTFPKAWELLHCFVDWRGKTHHVRGNAGAEKDSPIFFPYNNQSN